MAGSLGVGRNLAAVTSVFSCPNLDHDFKHVRPTLDHIVSVAGHRPTHLILGRATWTTC
jgi:hypothetical protein